MNDSNTNLKILRNLLRKNEILEENNLSDSVLQRFISGSDNAEEAYKMILDYLKWRKDFKVDEISLKDPDILEEASKNSVIILSQKDKLNRPVVFISVRNHNVQNRNLNKMIKYMVYIIERCCSKCCDNQDQLCIIFDMSSFSVSTNMDYAFLREMIHLFSRYYPERLGNCLVLNSPLIFHGCWNVLKHWLSEKTVQKVIFCVNFQQLNDFINPDYLPLDSY